MKCGIGSVKGATFKDFKEACGAAYPAIDKIINDKNNSDLSNDTILHQCGLCPDPPKKDSICWYWAGYILDNNKIDINQLKKYENEFVLLNPIGRKTFPGYKNLRLIEEDQGKQFLCYPLRHI